ncbi:glutathione S-transferase [Rhodovulum sulfidophilum]|uniref:Glutathione S-transferase N-terminal domain-containing protein n=1 Tax=Rhodovulum visakhapatnamense TaxID=364297 RepID=A0ABS1RDX7_9RHOB|nr:glutathione S-transferase [Rhodovulum visakhapatnamense]MBL3568069.1 glutathione S-transferase N-terminal domain-containing protein [Rhodovulum visakhapatnamense]MBL3577137.1 glutathione S-transferase N-terminal domain-containing protein [Rhodovulum visakhapatnamense]OLS45709.1 glutathione S-transferase [Rhodovulum sulfidophilum]
MTVKLYCFGESGNAYKAALTLTLAGIDWTPVYVDFFNGGARSPEFLALNPMGEVPVMVADDLVLSQSGVMQAWVTETTGRFGGRDAAEAREVLRWMFWDNHKMSGQAGSLRFMMNFLPEEKRPQEAIRWLSGRVTASLQTLERVLQDRDWLVGDGPTTADFACCGYLFYPEPFGFDRRALPAIDAWLGRIEALPGWKHPYDMMPGSPADRA